MSRVRKLLVVGCGSMGRRRIRHAQKMTGADIAVFDRREDRLADIENVTQLGDIAAMAEFTPDAMFICVPPADHEFYIDWAIAHGVHFMVEQPISHRPDNLDHLLVEVESRKLVTHVSNNHRFSAEVTVMKQVIDSGELGRALTGIVERGEWLPDWHPYEPYGDYYPSSQAMGGGLDSICDFAWMRFLFGEVGAAKSLFSKKSDLDIDTSDVVQILFDFADGPQIALHTDMVQRPYAGSVKIVFENGVLIHTAPEPVIHVYNAESRTWQDVPLDDGRDGHHSMPGKTDFNFVEPMYERDSLYFLEKLERGDAATDSLSDGIINLRIIHPLAGGH